jgi:hypothetical protein
MQFEEKFIAFIDILVFTRMVEAKEIDEAKDFSKLINLTQLLGSKDNVQILVNYGSTTCPAQNMSPKILTLRPLRFQIVL